MPGARCARWLRLGLILALGLSGARDVRAFILDWDANPWPSTDPTTLSHTVVGVGDGDVSITFTDLDGVLVRTPDGSPSSPNTNSFLNTPLNGGEQNLFVRATGNNGPNNVSIRFDFTHATGVRDLTFRIYDIDADLSQWQDVLDITAITYASGATINPDGVIGNGTSSWNWSAGTPTISALEPNQGNGNDNGTATVTFTTWINSLEIIYRNGASPFGNQWIAISDLVFVPEPDAGLLLATAGLIWVRLRRRA
jgi:hypothetical protein